MVFKKKKLLALLLFIVIIAFACFSECRIHSIEGMDDNSVPNCDDDPVPGCYNVVLDDYNVYGHSPNNDYINNAVPSYCPTCPTIMHGHAHANRSGAAEEIEGNRDTIANSIISNTEVTNVSSKNINESTSTNEVNKNTVNEYTINRNILNENITENEDESQTNNNNEGVSTNNNRNTNYENIISSLRSEINKLKQNATSSNNDDSCPPCPPCKRCPEPVFTCEKRINYRSPNVGDYLPLPVLNDFSTFDNNK